MKPAQWVGEALGQIIVDFRVNTLSQVVVRMILKRSTKFIRYYYLVTPAFAVLDLALGVEIRISIPGDHETLEVFYYLFCFSSSFIFFGNELRAALFSLAECILNIVLLFLSVILPIVYLPETISSGETDAFQFGANELIHFSVAGGVLLYDFYSNPIILHGYGQKKK